MRTRAALIAALLACWPAAAQVVSPTFKAGPAADAPAPAQKAPVPPAEPAPRTQAAPAPAPAPKAPVDAAAAAGLDFPKLTGRVVDAAGILPAGVQADITAKSTALEARTGAQFVVATVPSLQGYEIEEYGYRLGRAWGIGRQGKSDGVILLVAPNERRVRLEVGYGLEPVLTDALSNRIIRTAVLPRFREGDLPGGVAAGADAVLAQLGAEPADAAAAAAAAERDQRAASGGPGFGTIVWLLFLAFFVLPLIFRRSGKRTRRRGMPVVLWGPGMGGWGGGGGFGGFGGGGGGFSGGGGSFGGGGSSGSW